MRVHRFRSPIGSPHRLRATSPARRGGTSLTEVLAAILIMSVGVLAVMTLFPIAILRSIQATKLTNATILAKRADAVVEMFGLTSDTYIPQPQEGYVSNAVIDPLGWHDMVTVSTALAAEFGNNGSGGAVRYVPPIVQGQLAQPRFVNIGRDILLNGVVNSVGPTSGVPLRRLNFAVNPFGNSSSGGPGPLGPYPPLAIGLFGNPLTVADPVAARDDVLAAVGLPDHFINDFTGEPDASLTTPKAVGFPAAKFDLAHLDTTTTPPRLVPGSRITLFDLTGRRSQVRTYPGDGLSISQSGGNWIMSWTDALPSTFAGISEVRVDFPEARYTWMLTVRKRGIAGGSVTEIDCVAFFNRPSGDPSQELVLSADQPTYDPGRPNVPPTDTVIVSFAAGARPPIKKGGWVFDPQHCYWYRVLDVDKDSETTTSVPIQLERRAEQWIRNLIIPEGVINVFPLPSRVDQKRLDKARRTGRR